MGTIAVSPAAARPARLKRRAKRQVRDLSPEELRVQTWIRKNHGVLSMVAQETGKSVAFVQRIAYNREAQSKGFRIERVLRAKGCPLIQSIPGPAPKRKPVAQ